MLLTVIDLIESNDITDGWVRYDVRLVSRFRDYWDLVQERQRNAPEIPMPFHALGGDKIWERFTADGQPSLAIHQHAVSGNDDPRNGLALTPDAHWMFDAGLWTAIPNGDEFLIRVAHGRFTESSPQGRNLAALDQKLLHFHEYSRIRPSAEHLAWHHKTHKIA